MAERFVWQGTKWKLVRRGSRTYRASEVTLSYRPCECDALRKYRERAGRSSIWDTPGAVIEFPDGTKLVRDGHHRFAANWTMSCERYVAEAV